MEENQPVASPVQTTPPTPNPSGPDLSRLLLPALIIIILVLIGGVVFFDNIKTLVAGRPASKTNQAIQTKVQVTPTPDLRIDPKVVCARFTDLKRALVNAKAACILDLSNQNLTAVPPDVLKLTNLNQIILSGNKFTTFPQELTSIKGLISIDLSNNQITTVPDSIGQLTNLQVLDLVGNNLTAAEQTRVKELFLREERITQPQIQF